MKCLLYFLILVILSCNSGKRTNLGIEYAKQELKIALTDTTATKELLELEIEVLSKLMEKEICKENYELCCAFRNCINRARRKLSAWKPAP